MLISVQTIRLIGTLVLCFPSQALADQVYVATGPYVAIMDMLNAPDSISHEDFVELEDTVARGIDGVVKADGYAYSFKETHPVVPAIQFTRPYCRMAVSLEHSYFYISPFNPEPEVFRAPAYVRFRCALVKE